MNDLHARTLAQLRNGAVFAPDKPDETAESTLRSLWLSAAGTPMAVGAVHVPLPILTDAQALALEALVGRRLSGEPLAYIVGRQEFMGHDFLTTPGALIPRRETELLGKAAVALAQERAALVGEVRVLDLCTGSGNLAIALALAVPEARVWASDLEASAIALARKNVEHHNLGTRMTLLEGDLFRALEGQSEPASPFDLILCNPPYISTARAQSMPVEVGGFEPAAAFDGGDFGLSILFRLLAGAPQHLVPGGWLCFELGAGQGPLIGRRLSAQGAYSDIRTVQDHSGTVRALLARAVGGA